jgi:hypothetical protein
LRKAYDPRNGFVLPGAYPFVFFKGMTNTWIKNIKDYFKGFFLYGLLDEIHARKRAVDRLFLLQIFGKTIGIPSLFNYYTLRLLPYQMMRLEPWKKRILKERDFFDRIRD